MSVERLIAHQRLTTPTEHLGILIEPPADTLAALATADHAGELESAALLDTSIAELRRSLRQRLGLSAPVILTGHQVELIHAGVLAKSIAVDALAGRLGTTGVYLSVDFDLPKTTHVVAPHVRDDEVRRESVAIPGCDPRLPVEWQPRVPISQWQSFFDRLVEIAGSGDTLLHDYVKGVAGDQDDALSLSEVVEHGQAAINRVLDLAEPRRLRASQLSHTPEFRALLAHIMLNADDFAKHYNEAQQAYRARRGVRNPHRPVRLLGIDGDRIELPFWISREGQPRLRLHVTRQTNRVLLFAGEESVGTEAISRLRSAANQAEPWQVERDGWHVRPRALLLSAFARLLLSDLFIHGIGGAKYDEMTEDFIRRFLRVDLPPACCVSATLHLPLPRHGVDTRALAAARHARRDLRFNPQRHLSNLPQRLLERREELIRASSSLRQPGRVNRADRRRVFDEIRAVNHELLNHDAGQVTALEQQWDLVERQHRSDLAAFDREYFFALHDRGSMAKLVNKIRSAVGNHWNRAARDR